MTHAPNRLAPLALGLVPLASPPQACLVESSSPSKPAVTCDSRYPIIPKLQLPERSYSTGAERSFFFIGIST